MLKRFFYVLLTTFTLVATGFETAQAFSSSMFTYNSKLSTGKWVKFAVEKDGLYQITADQLAEMGFNDLTQVQIYGQGGHAIAENMRGTHTDDLAAVPMMVVGDKVIFYALGTVGKQMYDSTLSNPYYVRTRNVYANHGYYFITETSNRTLVTQQTATTAGDNWLTSSYGMFLHEQELMSPGLTGKHLMGESLIPDSVSIAFTLPNRSDSTVTIHVEGIAHASQSVYLETSVTSDGVTIPLTYTATEKRIRAVGANDPQRHYNSCATSKSVKLNGLADAGMLHVSLNNAWEATVRMSRLDYATITYKHRNSYEGANGSFMMGFPMLATADRVVMPGTDDATIVWNVTNPQQVTQMNLDWAINANGDTVGMGFTPGRNTSPSEFVAFNPALPLNEIGDYSIVENQNLHGLSAPDMLIVTNAYFKPEAERLAQMHRDHDAMTVHVVDQEQVFNEFSSGTPDAMGIRLLCKMLHDRYPTKFKNLLMFGPASYDFRGITTDKAHRVITYETDNGDSDETSYGTDDFFGVLDDNTGTSLPTQTLKLGVGRLTPADLTQARQNVDKIIHYVLNPDYGVWRNHYTAWADAGDSDLHALQAERIDSIIQTSLKTQMVADKAYVEMFPREGNISSEGRRHVADLLNYGQFYGTYVGHANTNALTSSRLWTINNVRNQSYDHQPIFMTACCDVARYDGNNQGIAESMFHVPNGGAIALLTSSREVEAMGNDRLNQAFTRALFSYNQKGYMPTLGEAYMIAKNESYGSLNKMSYLLLGDPAIKVEYPKPLFNITTVNGTDVTQGATVTVSPLQQVTVEADVYRAGSQSVNTTFNGDATLSIYDVRQLMKENATFKQGSDSIAGDIYFSRDLLTEVQGRVINGHFTGSAVLPRYFKATPGQHLAIHVYAHLDNSSEMVNGVTTQVVAATYSNSTAVQDNAAPVIEQMYLNELESFEQGVAVAANSTLHVKASDDVAFNNQSMGVGCTSRLVLDDGATTYTMLRNYLSIGDGGKTLELHIPVTGLTPGQHSLTLTIQDIAGNTSERTINFMVIGESNISLKTGDLVAIDEASIDLDQSDLANLPPMTLKVVNAQGHLVWTTTTSSLPYTWDLKDTTGQRVTPGLYKLFGQYSDGVNYGGTNIMPIIVMEPLTSSEQ